MTTQDKLIRSKLSLLELGNVLENVSEACRVMGVSRQHFYDIRKTLAEGGPEALRERSRRVPNVRNRVAPEVERTVTELALEEPSWGQLRVSNELLKKGVVVSAAGVRSIWLRHGLETMKQRLRKLEEKSAREGLVYTESQLAALEKSRRDEPEQPETIETEHPGYLVSQDTFYVGYLKGVGRIYQQTVVDTYSSVAFAKLYVTKAPLTAADALNDRVVPFFEAHEIAILRMLTDRGTEYCGRPESHPYEVYLGLNDIEHTKTKARSPQTNGICERFHRTILDEFYRVEFRKRIFATLEELHAELDAWIVRYNHERTHEGKRCQGRTPMQTFLDGKELARQKMIA